jgi:SAM-dependent methyltransferase
MPSFDRPRDPDIAPSAWVCRFAALIRPGGRVLDVACGSGRHARWLATRGFHVLATDVDVSGLADLRDTPGIEIVEADLEGGHWPFADRSFDGIVVTNYLHRPHFPHLARALAPSGVLIFETFGAGNELLGRPRNPAFLLRPGELFEAFAGELQVVAYEHGAETRPRRAVRQRLCAVRVTTPVALPEPVGASAPPTRRCSQ